MDISKRLHEDEPFFSWRVPKWLKIISIELSKTFPILLQQHSTSLERNVFVTRCTVINGRPGGGGLKNFLESCMDYKIYCGLKYASYLHVILAPKSRQGIRLQILGVWNTLLCRVVRNERSMPRSTGNSTVLKWRGKVMDDWSWTHLPLLAKISIWPQKNSGSAHVFWYYSVSILAWITKQIRIE